MEGEREWLKGNKQKNKSARRNNKRKTEKERKQRMKAKGWKTDRQTSRCEAGESGVVVPGQSGSEAPLVNSPIARFNGWVRLLLAVLLRRE